jgi:hypothetical protein
MFDPVHDNCQTSRPLRALALMAGALGVVGIWGMPCPGYAQEAAAVTEAPVPVPVPADTSPNSAESGTPGEPTIAAMPIVFAPLPDLDDAARDLFATDSQTFEATLTANLLQSVGNVTRLADNALPVRRNGPVDPFRATPPANLANGGNLTALVNPTFGSREGVAVSISPRLVGSGAVNTDIRVHHAGDIVDADFNLAAHRQLFGPDATAMRFDSHALVSVAPAMQLGVTARGSLGTLSAPTLGHDDIAGPLMQLNLVNRNVSLVSDLGYDFGLNSVSAATRNQLYFKLNLKLKL